MYKDPFTGKYHTHFRDYDPITCRWLSEDPAGYADGLNLYNAYMGVNGRDPLGLDKLIEDDQGKAWYVPENTVGFDGTPLFVGMIYRDNAGNKQIQTIARNKHNQYLILNFNGFDAYAESWWNSWGGGAIRNHSDLDRYISKKGFAPKTLETAVTYMDTQYRGEDGYARYTSVEGASAGASRFFYSIGEEIVGAQIGKGFKLASYLGSLTRRKSYLSLSKASNVARKRGTLRPMANTGIGHLDKLVHGSPRMEKVLQILKSRGFKAKAIDNYYDASSGSYADIIIENGKKGFYYDPDKFRMIDLMHELLHFRQIKRNGGLVGWRNSASRGFQNIHSMELEAYQMEKALLLKYGDDVSGFYHEYLDDMIDYFGGI